MTQEILIEVTADDIEVSSTGSRSRCPISLALRRAFPNANLPLVDRNSIRFTDRVNKLRYTYRTPDSAQRFVDSFDNGTRKRGLKFKLTDTDLVEARPMAEQSPVKKVTTKQTVRKARPAAIPNSRI